MSRPRLPVALCATLAGLCAACSTPAPVLELADRSAANAGILSTRLHQLAAESDRLYADRVDNIAALNDGVAAQRSAFNLDLLRTRRAGGQADLDRLEEIRKRYAETTAVLATNTVEAAQQRRKALLDVQIRFDTHTAALQAVAEKLATLAREASPSERAKLFAQFARAVRDDVNKQLDDGSKASVAAQALVDQLKADLKPATKPQPKDTP
jgi:hypothetical protein